MIKTLKHKGLEAFYTKGDTSKLPVENHDKVRRILARLDASMSPEDMNIPGFSFHGLNGKPKRYAVKASANYRVTFGWEDGDAIAVDIEDYH